jgi:hypothetical protein
MGDTRSNFIFIFNSLGTHFSYQVNIVDQLLYGGTKNEPAGAQMEISCINDIIYTIIMTFVSQVIL